MVEFLFLFVMLISCIIGILIGSVNKVKGPKGTLVKDEMTANWLKEIDGPEEPMTDIDYNRVLRSYNVSLSNKPIYAVFFFAIAVTVYLVGWAVGFEMIHKMIGVIFIVASVATLFILLQKNRSVFDAEWENFTKKKAILIDTKSMGYLNTPGARRVSGELTGEIYTMRIGVCNRDGKPYIYTIPVLSDLYSVAVKLEKFEVIMYKGKFSSMLAFMTEEEAEAAAELEAQANAQK